MSSIGSVLSKIVTIPFFMSITAIIGCAQVTDLEKIKAEIEEVSLQEIEAFKIGDCDSVSSFMDDKATFYMNGKQIPHKSVLIGFCKKIPRPFEKPSSVSMNYFPIDLNTAYVVRVMEFSKESKVYKKEVVTKIWVKKDEKWRITHIHSTITEIAGVE